MANREPKHGVFSSLVMCFYFNVKEINIHYSNLVFFIIVFDFLR